METPPVSWRPQVQVEEEFAAKLHLALPVLHSERTSKGTLQTDQYAAPVLGRVTVC